MDNKNLQDLYNTYSEIYINPENIGEEFVVEGEYIEEQRLTGPQRAAQRAAQRSQRQDAETQAQSDYKSGGGDAKLSDVGYRPATGSRARFNPRNRAAAQERVREIGRQNVKRQFDKDTQRMNAARQKTGQNFERTALPQKPTTPTPKPTTPAAKPTTPAASRPATPAKPATSSSLSKSQPSSTQNRDSTVRSTYDKLRKTNPAAASKYGMAASRQKFGDTSKPKTPNPLMSRPKPTTPINTSASSNTSSLTGNKSSSFMSKGGSNANKKTTIMNNTEWPSAKTVKDLSSLYSSIYEAKKKDQDEDGDKDFADVMIARMMASGMSKAEAIEAVKNKEYNEEFELDEATRMRKELGKEGETAIRKELAARSKAHKRSGSIDKTIAAAERGADRPYIKHKRNESDEDRKNREERQSRTLRGLAASRKGSVRDKPRAGLRGYAAKVKGDDRDLQSARSSARSAGTLTPKEKKDLGEEYKLYEIVASYLLENNFVEDIDDLDNMIESMSSEWVEVIVEEYNNYVEEYNMFIEDLEIAGYDLSEATEEDIEEAYKDVDKKKAVERAADKERAAREIERYSSSRAKGKSKSNRMAPAFDADRRTKAAKKDDGYKGKESDSPEEGYGDMSKYTGDIYAKKFKPGKSVPKVMKFGRPFGKYQPRAIKFSDIKKMGLD